MSESVDQTLSQVTEIDLARSRALQNSSHRAPCESPHSMLAPRFSGRASRFTRGLVVKALDCAVQVSGFETQAGQCINLFMLFVSRRRHKYRQQQQQEQQNTCILCVCKTIPC